MTKIEWTEKTWNPVVGCSIVSPGCTNCYAMTMAARIERMGGAPQYDGTTKPSRAGAVWTGKVALAEKALLEPLKRKKPTMYFVNSMGDLFHEDVPDAWIDRVFAVMALCPQHTFQVLTKRSARMREYLTKSTRPNDAHPEDHRRRDSIAVAAMKLFIDLNDLNDGNEYAFKTAMTIAQKHPLPNVWLGVSAEDQTRADDRIPDLLATPAAVRFVSAEPLLGPINFLVTNNEGHDISALRGIACDPTIPDGADEYYRTGKLDWVIVGGESGKGARPMHPDWARSLRDQCANADVAFFFKQWGEYCTPLKQLPSQKGDITCWPDGTIGNGNANENGGAGQSLRRAGKKAAGRVLDGCTHDGMPERTTP